MVGAWREMRETWRRQRDTPEYQFDTPLPATATKALTGTTETAVAESLEESIGDLAPDVLDE